MLTSPLAKTAAQLRPAPEQDLALNRIHAVESYALVQDTMSALMRKQAIFISAFQPSPQQSGKSDWPILALSKDGFGLAFFHHENPPGICQTSIQLKTLRRLTADDLYTFNYCQFHLEQVALAAAASIREGSVDRLHKRVILIPKDGANILKPGIYINTDEIVQRSESVFHSLAHLFFE